MLEAFYIPDGFGLLTGEEAADRYSIDSQRITDAVDAEEVGSVTLMSEEGTELILLPTMDGAVAQWLEAQ